MCGIDPNRFIISSKEYYQTYIVIMIAPFRFEGLKKNGQVSCQNRYVFLISLGRISQRKEKISGK